MKICFSEVHDTLYICVLLSLLPKPYGHRKKGLVQIIYEKVNYNKQNIAKHQCGRSVSQLALQLAHG